MSTVISLSADLCQQHVIIVTSAQLKSSSKYFGKKNTYTPNWSTSFQFISVYERKASIDKPLTAYIYDFIFVFRIHNDMCGYRTNFYCLY